MDISSETISWVADKLAESRNPDYVSFEENGEIQDQIDRQQWLNNLMFLSARVSA